MGVVVVRVVTGVFFLVLVALAVRRRARLGAWLREFFLAPVPPASLGLLRIVVFGLLWNGARFADPEWHAALPPALRLPPPGWDLLGALPFHAGAAATARDLLVLTSAAATLGLFTRITVPVSALLAVYVFGIPQCFGKVNHGGHARMLAALVIALSPSGDALSLDALVRRLRGVRAPEPSAAYGLPLRAVWVLVGTTYFFPGLWKLLESGDLWISGQQLRFELYRRWGSAPDFRPLVRLDLHPWTLPVLGAGTILFELGFLFAMFERRARVVAALGAVGFHLGVAAVMGIRFPPYVPLLVLVEAPDQWGALGKRLSERAGALAARAAARLSVAARAFPARSVRASAVLFAALLVAQVAAGVTKTSSWPISIYPAFSARKDAAATRPHGARILLETTDGGAQDLGPVLRKARVASATRVIERLADRATNKGVRTQGREIVRLFRHLGVRVDPGDHIVLLESEWDLFPIGKREGFREWTERRFLVREDDSLSGLRVDRRPGLAAND